MTGIVRPARAGPNKVTKSSPPTTGRRQSHHNLLTAAAVLAEQQRRQQPLEAAPSSLRTTTAAADGDRQTQLLRPRDSLAATSDLDDNRAIHEHHLQVMVDLHLPDADAKSDHDPLQDDGQHAAKAVDAAEMAATVTQNLELGADANLLAGNPALLDASESVPTSYSSPPQANRHPDPGPDHDEEREHEQQGHRVAADHGHDRDHAYERGSNDHDHDPSVGPVHHRDLDFGAAMRSTEELANASGYSGFVIESALAKRLAREPGLRHAQQRRPEQSLNLARRSNVEALFAHIAGEEVVSPCKNCRKGHGPWTSCVIVDGQMCGSCANCWFNASGARCSFHETRNVQGHSLQSQPPQAHHNAHSLHTAAAPPGQDPYGIGSPMNLAPPLAPSGGNLNFGSVINTADAAVRYAVERSISDVCAADKKARQLMKIEIAAKQLALHILEYEEMTGQREHEPPGGNGIGPHVPHSAGGGRDLG